MRTSLYFGVVTVCVITGCARHPLVPLSVDELQIISAVGRTQQEAINAEDLEATVALYEPNAVSLPPGWEALQGREAIRDFWEGQLTGVEGTGSYKTIAIYGENDLAYEAGTYTYSYTDGAGVKTTRYGKFLAVFRRQPDGSWRIAAEMWNLTPAPARAPSPE